MMEHQDITLDCQLKQFCHILVFEANPNVTFRAFLEFSYFENLFAQIMKSSCQYPEHLGLQSYATVPS